MLKNHLVYLNGALGAGINILLMYFIITDHQGKTKNYRYMLGLITLYNIYYSIALCVIDMILLIDDRGFLMFSANFAPYGWWPSYLASLVYVDNFTVSLALLTVHCLYRYVKITGKHNFLFDTPLAIFGVTVVSLGSGIVWLLFCALSMSPSYERSEYSRQIIWEMHSIDTRELGYLGPIYLYPDASGVDRVLWKNFIGSAGCMLIMVSLYTAIWVFGIRLFFFIRGSLVSAQTKKIQLQLMQLLVIQATVPLIFEYAPCLMCVWGGYIGIPFTKEYSLYGMVFISAYAPVDAISSIVGFPIYRRRLLKCARRRKIYSTAGTTMKSSNDSAA